MVGSDLFGDFPGGHTADAEIGWAVASGITQPPPLSSRPSPSSQWGESVTLGGYTITATDDTDHNQTVNITKIR